ncbi:competence protein ComEC [Trinickia symbiotica]|uniref:DNA internalization-related competence protein ComEC/Rec2 n=1 Tax=Trinickia symbiotica TaxID=863227 RepID=A0A2N7WWT5_9BURK|nr:DNA internalization-related competence protein ComEC/Rec2 [Trinickia symbiotica]PMS33953.1 DNA internalization-related competence protein ComEC/Rec2 [Trinickia symbiotica]PPK42570.1 competence protein ComEC [Trinickia symbiotica]
MRLVLCGFVLGVVLLQQQPALPGPLGWGFGATLWVAAIALAAVLAARCRANPAEPGNGAGAPIARMAGAMRLGACFFAAVVAGFGYAAGRADLRLRDALPAQWEGRDLVLSGHVHGLPVRDARSMRFLFSVDTDEVRRDNGIERFPPLVQLSWLQRGGDRMPTLVPGERWRLTVRLKRPHGHANFGGHNLEATLFARGVRATGYVAGAATARRLPGSAGGLASAIDRWRFALAARIGEALSAAPHRGIVLALAIGAQEAIDSADRAVLRRTGTSHLVAISGLHIGFVAGLGAALAAWLWRRSCFFGAKLARDGSREWPLIVPTPIVAAVAGTFCAAAYAALAGFNVPAQRALWMLIVVSLAFVFGRSVAPSLVLAWAAALVVIVDPWAVVAAGFWLSFGAVAAISLALHGRLRIRSPHGDEMADDLLDPFTATPRAADPPRRSRWHFVRRGIARAREQLAGALRAQYAVTIGLAPLTAFWFSQISLAGPFANALAVPWVSVLVTPVVLIGVALPAPFDSIAFELAHALLEPLMRILQRLSDEQWAEWRMLRPSAVALACAAAGVVWCLMPRGWPLRFAAPIAWLPLAFPPPASPEPGEFRLTALDVGQGSAIVVETARHALLFDAGPGPESTHAGERIVAPYLLANGLPELDALVVSHADADHAGGAPAVLEAVHVRQLLGGLPPANTLWRAARAAGAETVRCASGQRWRWDGVDFTILWPRPGPLPVTSNAGSCVLKVEADGFAALLTGDIDAAVEGALQREATAVSGVSDALAADVLLVAHHGSKTSSTESFLDSVRPRIAVFQVGYRNRFGHPHPGVWSRFVARGVELTRTDRDGAARIALRNGVLTLERYRDTHRRYWMDR